MRINIAEPCHENWEGMGPNPNGKHCSKCDKTVYDFSSYSDSEIINFFKSGPKVCGRFKGTQLGRDLSHTRTLSSKWAIAACSVLLLASNGLQAQNEVQISKDSGQETVSQISVILTRVINATFNEASTHEACISRIRIKIDSFAIDLDIDSSRKASVTIPQTLSGERVDVELFNIKGDTFHLDSVNLGMGDIVFSPLANAWTYFNPWKYEWSIPEPPIFQYMGIPMPYTWGFADLNPIVALNTKDTPYLFSMGDTISIQATDTAAITRTAKETKPVKSKKKGVINGGFLGLIAAFSALMLIAWLRFKNKIKA